MYKKRGKKLTSVLLAASMTFGLAACGGEAQTTTENVPQTEAAEAPRENGSSDAGAAAYTPTEENGNLELTMNGQPESSYWFPAQLLEWNADADEDFI